LGPGDLIFTGTPAGVGPVQPGDLLECAIEGVATLTTRIGAAE
jgi:fumarylpyruvate hydrolase